MDKDLIDLVASARADIFHHYPFDEHLNSARNKLTQVIEVWHDRHLSEPSSRPDKAKAQLQTLGGITCEATNTNNQQSGA